jgi:hypothetical protein
MARLATAHGASLLVVANPSLNGTMPNNGVQAELQMPSIITRSWRSRIRSCFAFYSLTSPT